jgi:hypothetical protein
MLTAMLSGVVLFAIDIASITIIIPSRYVTVSYAQPGLSWAGLAWAELS